MQRYKENRQFMKADFKILDEIKTDRQKGMPFPPFQKENPYKSKAIILPRVTREILTKPSVFDCLEDRRSVRRYVDTSISMEQLSYLLWATQGIQSVSKNGTTTLRRTPSGGASHPFETYLIINRVQGLKIGIYRYLPLEHQLVFMHSLDEMDKKVDKATDGQPFVANFVAKSAVIFAWSCIPYRAEYKFDLTAHKKILIDIGHVCQNLYIASESIGLGTCAIGIYDQEYIDEMLNLDGEDEFIIYMAAVGEAL